MTSIRNSYKQRACAPRTSSDKQRACAPRTPLFKHLSRACACLTSSYTCAFRRQALWDSLPVALVSGMVHPMSEIGMYDETHTLHSAPLHTFSQISIIKRQRTAFAQPRELQAIYVTPAMGIPEKKATHWADPLQPSKTSMSLSPGAQYVKKHRSCMRCWVT